MQRSFLLFLIGVALNTIGTNAQLENIRIFGVLQRFGITYLVVGLIYLCFICRQPKAVQVRRLTTCFLDLIIIAKSVIFVEFIAKLDSAWNAGYIKHFAMLVRNANSNNHTLRFNIWPSDSRMSHVRKLTLILNLKYLEIFLSANYIHISLINYIIFTVGILGQAVDTKTVNILIVPEVQLDTSIKVYWLWITFIKDQPLISFMVLGLLIPKAFWVTLITHIVIQSHVIIWYSIFH